MERFLIGSGASFSLGFITGIFFALGAPNPRTVLLENLYTATIESIGSMPVGSKTAGILVIFVLLLITLYVLREVLEEITGIVVGGIIPFLAGFVAGILIVSNIYVFVWIAIVILLVASSLGWLKKR